MINYFTNSLFTMVSVTGMERGCVDIERGVERGEMDRGEWRWCRW